MERKYGRLDLHRFAREVFTKSATKPTGHCARFVHDAMSAAGLKLPLRDAWQYSHVRIAPAAGEGIGIELLYALYSKNAGQVFQVAAPFIWLGV